MNFFMTSFFFDNTFKPTKSKTPIDKIIAGLKTNMFCIISNASPRPNKTVNRVRNRVPIETLKGLKLFPNSKALFFLSVVKLICPFSLK